MTSFGNFAILVCVLIYKCSAQSDLFLPPSITVPHAAVTHYIKNGDDKNISCRATGTQPITYSWTRNGEPITSNTIFIVDATTGSLTVKGFTTREDGRYQCSAQNTFPTDRTIQPLAMSQVVTMLQMQDGGSWEVPLKEVVGTEGGYIGLECTGPPATVPKARFGWFRIEGGNQQVQKTERVYIDKEGTLHFIYLETTDQVISTNSEYKCSIFNSETGDSIRLGSPTKLSVNALAPGTGISQQKPQNKYKTTNLKFSRTQTAELECVFSGYPIPTVTWKNNQGNVIDPSSNPQKYEYVADTYNRRLIVKNLQENDEGPYTCEGLNDAGKATTTVYLDVTSGPIWKQGLSNHTLPVGRDAVFTCMAEAPRGESRLPDPVWYKNGVQLYEQTGKLEFSERGSVLTVRKIEKPTDIMCFQCNVSNTAAFEWGDACLNVIEPISVTYQPSERQEVGKGDRIELTVQATTDPAFTIKYSWLFNNISYEFTPPPHVIYDEATKIAYINTSQLTDQQFENVKGTYIISLYHQFNSKNITVHVTTKAPPGAIVTQAAFPWWIIVVVILIILLIVVILLILFCCCRNKEQGAYRIYKTELNTAYLHPDEDIEQSKFKDVARIESEDDDNMVKVPLRGDDSEV